MIFIDRSLPKPLARILQSVDFDAKWLEPTFKHNTPDVEWLPEVGKRGWLVITRDKHIRERPLEAQAVVDGNVGLFCFSQKKDSKKMLCECSELYASPVNSTLL